MGDNQMMGDLMVESAARCIAEGDSAAIAEVISSAVSCVYSPTSTPENRRAANKIIEEFKETSDICAEVGFWLARPENSVELRHFGLQAVEHVIKYRWSDISPEKRCMIKYNCTELIKKALSRNGLILESVSKCLVEMAKREWPQHWPEFLPDCQTIMTQGVLQNEVILVTLLRLVQDVVTLSNMDQAWRRKELHNSLALSIPQIFQVALKTMKSCAIGAYGAHGTPENHLCQVTLELLGEILEWAPYKDLTDVQTELYPLISRFLSFERHGLHMYAAACLWQLASRKTGKNEMEPFLGLFGSDVMNAILNATQSGGAGGLNQDHYLLLKSLAAILVTMGQTLFRIWGIHTQSSFFQGPPENFDLYMKALLGFLEHPSLCLRNQAALVLSTFVHSDVICGTEPLKQALPTLIEIIPIICLKKGYPSMSDCATCEYSKLDYESDVEFLVEHGQFRERVSRILEKSTSLNWRLGWDVCNRWFNERFLNEQEMLSVSLEEWDCMVRFFRSYLEKLSRVDIHFKSMVVQDRGGSLLNGVLRVVGARKAPWNVLDHHLSILSTLFVFLPTHPDKVTKIVDTLFVLLDLVDEGSVVQTPWELEGPGEEDGGLKAVKFHCLNILINIATQYPDHILPLAEAIFVKSQEVGNKLSVMFQAKILETLSTLSNKFKDPNKQKEFVKKAIQGTIAFWSSAEVNNAVSKPEVFLDFIGLCSQAPESDEVAVKSVSVGNRMNLLGHAGILEAVLMRIEKPDQATKKTCHPVFEEVAGILPAIFLTARCLNGIYSKACLSKIHSSFGGVSVLDLPETEKQTVYSAAEPIHLQSAQGAFKRVTNADHVRAWISNITDKIYTVIGLLVTRFDWEFYGLEAGSEYLRHGALGLVEECMDLRLRTALKKMWRPMVSHLAIRGDWNPQFVEVLFPSVSYVLEHTYHRLAARWEQIMALHESEDTMDKTMTKQEAFMEDVACLLSREHLSLLIRALVVSDQRKQILDSRAHGDNDQDEMKDEGEAKMEEDAMDFKNKTGEGERGGKGANRPPAVLSNLGVKLMQSESSRSVVVMSMFHGMLWLDTGVLHKLFILSQPIVVYLMEGNLLDEASVSHIFQCVIQALKIHGQHDVIASSLVAIAADIYEFLRPSYPVLREMLLALPNVPEEELKSFDLKLSVMKREAENGSLAQKSKPPVFPMKLKKQKMKKILRGAIGVNVGQQYKKDVQIRNLPPLLKPERKKPDPEFNLDILELFNQQKE